MKIKHFERPSGRDILIGTGLTFAAAAIAIPVGKEVREAWFPDTVASADQEPSHQSPNGPSRSYRDPELSIPTPKASSCSGRIGSIAIHNHTPDLDFVTISTIKPNATGDKAMSKCAELYNPNSGTDLIDLVAGDRIWVCKEGDGDLEASVSITTKRKLVGKLDVSPDFHATSGTIIDCEDVDNWTFNPSESANNADNFNVRNDTLFYNPDYDYLKKDDPACYDKTYGIVNWNDPNCFSD